jgi:Flp pilus assembly pilin Flp
MNRIKQFFKDERGDAYITSIVICTGVIAISLAVAYTNFFTGLGTAFTSFTGKLNTWYSGLAIPGS